MPEIKIDLWLQELIESIALEIAGRKAGEKGLYIIETYSYPDIYDMSFSFVTNLPKYGDREYIEVHMAEVIEEIQKNFKGPDK